MTVISALGGNNGSLIELPNAPTNDEKTSYAWRSLPYLVSIITISAICVTIAQLWVEIRFSIMLPFLVYTIPYMLYQLLSIPVNFGGRSFDLAAHELDVMTWRPQHYPGVDIFLPICGEPISVLRNTWNGVVEMRAAYRGTVLPWVLDDGHDDQARELADEFGFNYIRREERTHKKAGNLRHAFAQTSSEFIVIFDADFRPRADFLAETLPYMDDPELGILQTPQFFRSLRSQTWVEQAAAVTLEVFYRSVQQARDRFGSALCVGSNAVYRRKALESSGGCFLIPYAEDSHTGLDARAHGYQLKYVPVALAAGICPSTVDSFMRQQYRWSNGATSLIWHGHMWRCQMPFRSRLPYVAGWMWNFTTALRTVILPLIPITLLAILPNEIRLRNAILLIPTMIVGVVLYPLWHNARWTLATWPVAIAVGWAQVLSLWDNARGKVMTWQPTMGPAATPRRFRKCVIGWNGTLSLVWLGLAIWRVAQTGSPQFIVVTLFGIINLIIVGRIAFPGKAR
jgi:cellulose synthase/poly-beta-1,6-N-acetylglucosamine synthase-like glycosyltransferase